MARQVRSPSAEFPPSTDTIYQAVIKMIDQVFVHTGNGRHLDIGSGDGRLLKLISDSYPLRQSACDYSSRFMKRPNLPVDTVDLNHERLPYPDEQFDLVTCVETIDHLENFREVIREIYRSLVREINTLDLLLGRTLIVAAHKRRQIENGNGGDEAGAPG